MDPLWVRFTCSRNVPKHFRRLFGLEPPRWLSAALRSWAGTAESPNIFQIWSVMFSRWWQLKYYLLSPRKLGKMNPFWLIFFNWVVHLVFFSTPCQGTTPYQNTTPCQSIVNKKMETLLAGPFWCEIGDVWFRCTGKSRSESREDCLDWSETLIYEDCRGMIVNCDTWKRKKTL